MITLIHAHPYPRRSRASSALLAAVRGLPGVEVRSLYDMYPDFDIDVAAEQAALERARLVIWLCPLYWYTVPAMLKHWFDVVLVGGWAHDEGGTALEGKECLWVTTTGDLKKYAAEMPHGHPFDTFVPVVEQTARYCGMEWLEPFVLHDSDEVNDEHLARAGRKLHGRLELWLAEHRPHV